jgi:hypothetical protein
MLEQIMEQVQRLTIEERIRLMQQIAVTVLTSLRGSRLPGPGLVYGEFHGPKLSTEDDFGLSE